MEISEITSTARPDKLLLEAAVAKIRTEQKALIEEAKQYERMGNLDREMFRQRLQTFYEAHNWLLDNLIKGIHTP